MFDLSTAFADVLGIIVRNIPLGMDLEQDKSFNLLQRDELFECTLILFQKVTEYFNCTTYLGGEWEVITGTNKRISILLKDTHSDESLQTKIFTPEVYERIKHEKSFETFIYSENHDRFIETNKKAKDRDEDETLSKIDFFADDKPYLEKTTLEKLRSKFSRVELIMQLLNLTQTKVLNNGFLQCVSSLYDTTNAFVGKKDVSKAKRRQSRLETLNSIYGKPDLLESNTFVEMSTIPETSNEETEADARRGDMYLKQLHFEFDEYKLQRFRKLELALQDFCATLLIFIRCELAARAYYAMREFVRVNFYSGQIGNKQDAIKPESSITSLLSDFRKIFNLLSNQSANNSF